MRKNGLAEFLETVSLRRIKCRHQPGVGVRFLHQGDRSAAMVNRLRRKESPRQQRQRVLLRRYGTGGAGNHRPSDTADQRDRRRHQRIEPIPGTVQYRTDPAAAGRR